MRRLLRRSLRYLLLVLASGFLLVEEALWALSGLLAPLGRLPILRAGEAWIQGLPPWGALALFGIPSAALFPIKLLALYWLAGGHPVWGIGIIATAKVVGTAVVARLFHLTERQLLQIAWFARCHGRVLALRSAAYGMWRNSPFGQAWLRFRQRSRGWLRRQWDAILAKRKARRPRES